MDTYTQTLRDTHNMQLQLWDAKTKTYIPQTSDTPRGKSWRICKPDRPTNNPKHRPRKSHASVRSIADVRSDYFEWAQDVAKLDTITDWVGKYTNCPFPNVRRVNPDDYFSVEVSSDERSS